jgi:hypothetical protein
MGLSVQSCWLAIFDVFVVIPHRDIPPQRRLHIGGSEIVTDGELIATEAKLVAVFDIDVAMSIHRLRSPIKRFDRATLDTSVSQTMN